LRIDDLCRNDIDAFIKYVDKSALLLALGFAGALRRSELVGLDWKEQGSGDGVVTRDERGIVLTLLRTKGGKGEPEAVIVLCQDMPTACEALERWAKTANLQPGEPGFGRSTRASTSPRSPLPGAAWPGSSRRGCVPGRWPMVPARLMRTRWRTCAAVTAYGRDTARRRPWPGRRSGRSGAAAGIAPRSWWRAMSAGCGGMDGQRLEGDRVLNSTSRTADALEGHLWQIGTASVRGEQGQQGLAGSGQTFLARRERIAARLAGVTAPAVPRFEPGPRWERVVTANCTRRADDPPRPTVEAALSCGISCGISLD
jgi:hypothetical protein